MTQRFQEQKWVSHCEFVLLRYVRTSCEGSSDLIMTSRWMYFSNPWQNLQSLPVWTALPFSHVSVWHTLWLTLNNLGEADTFTSPVYSNLSIYLFLWFTRTSRSYRYTYLSDPPQHLGQAFRKALDVSADDESADVQLLVDDKLCDASLWEQKWVAMSGDTINFLFITISLRLSAQLDH